MTEQNRKLKNRVRETCSHGSVRGQDHDGPALLGSTYRMNSLQDRLMVPVIYGVVLALFALTCARGEDPAIPEIKLPACAQGPVLDGSLKDACWQSAAVLTNFFMSGDELTIGNVSVKYCQRALVIRDDQWLYVAVEIRHPAPDQRKPTCFDHDGSVSADDDIEVFIDPGTEGKLYCHYLLNSANTRAEQRVVTTPNGIQRERAWNLPWRSATAQTPTGWIAELAVPLFIIADYGDTARARFNIGITMKQPVIDPYGIQAGMKGACLSVSPVRKSFHDCEQFARLRGLEGVKIATPFLPAFSDFQVGAYTATNDQFSYAVSCRVQNHSARTGMVELVIVDEPMGESKKEISRQLPMAAKMQQAFQLQVPVGRFAGRSASILMRDAATGEILQSARVENPATLSIMSAYTDRNYYTTETKAVIVCELALPADLLKTMQLAVLDAKGGPLVKTASLNPETRMELPLQSIPEGACPINVELQDKNAKAIYREKMEIVKRAPRPGLERKIDRINLQVLADDKPILPFGVIFQHPSGQARKPEDLLGELQAAGIRDVSYWSRINSTNFMHYLTAKELMAMADRYDLRLYDYLDAHISPRGSFSLKEAGESLDSLVKAGQFDEAEKKYSEIWKAKREIIQANLAVMAPSPRLMAHVSIDEPFDTKYTARGCRDLYRLIQADDAYRPVFLNCGNFDDDCDIIGADPYWVPASPSPSRDTPLAVIRYLYGDNCWYFRNYVKLSKKMRKPVWMVPVGERYSGMHKRPLLPDEQFCQTYLLLIHGVKGLFYFCYPFNRQLTLDTLGKLAGEMETLGPIVTAPGVPQTITYSPGKMDPDKQQFPDVHAALYKNPQGGYVLLAANSTYYPVDTTFGVSFLGSSGKAERLFSRERLEIKDGKFSERLERCAVRAYRLDGPDKLSDPASVSVTMQAHPDLSTQDKVQIPRTGRPGKKNIVPNPSFEEATFPNWPDYYWHSDENGVFPRTGQPGARMEQDTTQAWHGKASLKLIGRPKLNYLSWWPGVTLYLSPKVSQPTQYVLSAYMKADKDGMRAAFFPDVAGKENRQQDPSKAGFALTTEWKRYSETGVIPAGRDAYSTLGIRAMGEGTVWVDGFQLEVGSEPTEFEP